MIYYIIYCVYVYIAMKLKTEQEKMRQKCTVLTAEIDKEINKLKVRILLHLIFLLGFLLYS